MKINAIKFYTCLFIIVLFIQLYASSFRFIIFFEIFVLLLLAFLEKQKISLRFVKIIMPIIVIFLLGFFGMVFHKYHIFNIIKDIFHFIKPILGLLIGYIFYKRINDFKLFLKTIILTGFLSSIVHFIIILSIPKIATVSDIRQFGTDNFIELMALLFLLFYKKFQKERLFQNNLVHTILVGVLLTSCILYFSRTMIIMAIVVILSILGYTIITRKTIKIMAALVIFTLLFYAFLFSITIPRNKSGVSTFFYKIKNAPAEVFKFHIDRENHSDLWDHWRGYEAKRAIALLQENPSGIICGLGYGSLVNLKFYAPLSDNAKGMRYISELHNGYAYMLYKIGIVGLFLYLFFLYTLYIKIYYNKNIVTLFVSGFALSFFITTLVTVGINNNNDTIILVIGALLFFDEKNTATNATTSSN
jgi:hypothetical protein